MMNVSFNLATPEMEKRFLAEAPLRDFLVFQVIAPSVALVLPFTMH